MDLKKYIKDKSKELGIDIIGFTNAEKFDQDINHTLKLRREKSYETEFEEENIEKRTTPKQILESGKSIIVIGMSYYKETNDQLSQDEKPRGKLSKSSLGLDYHILLRDKMEKLVEVIKELDIELDYSIGVDTTPLMDRHLARKAGVGFRGKNSNIINDSYGSFIFLGYIITNLYIEEDSVAEEKCGDCDICIRSCPVGAIKPNYELNARRCISYLTQTKEDIPYLLRDKMGTRLYGCDTCQLVCPKNKDIIEQSKSILHKDLLEYIDIEELFEMSNRQFKDKYGHIAFSWRGKNVIKRNAIIVLGNLKEKSHMPLLEKSLKDESVMIRKYSAWAIIKIDKINGIEILEEHKKYEKNKQVIDEIETLKKYFNIS